MIPVSTIFMLRSDSNGLTRMAERQPAYEEARRGTFDPQYLLYTVGKLGILKLRSDLRKQEGQNFSLQQFHSDLLEHGAPPLRLLRERLLHDPKSWNALF